MFTGLIVDVASVAALRRNGAGATLEIRSRLAGELDEGDSIAVNGVCLTVSEVEAGGFQAEVMAETLSRSSLGDLQPGSEVNLELPLRSVERLGGHIVQGHVDGTGTVSAVHEDGFGRVLEIGIDEQLARYVVEKGSVAVDGVSLTVSALHDRGFAVSLIPETLKRTNLGRIGEGAVVNVEVDILAKHVERLIGARR
ncbi:MAG: riboflavin synthase [Solirubrobacteraceae bacterium]